MRDKLILDTVRNELYLPDTKTEFQYVAGGIGETKDMQNKEVLYEKYKKYVKETVLKFFPDATEDEIEGVHDWAIGHFIMKK